jgi:hypothetical protein
MEDYIDSEVLVSELTDIWKKMFQGIRLIVREVNGILRSAMFHKLKDEAFTFLSLFFDVKSTDKQISSTKLISLFAWSVFTK